jgi:DNA (cytosine-5)-methyltransferase 1
MKLVLSLFPGIGLLDRAFEEVGFCVVRGPDLLWGGDIKQFHPPAGKFDGVIGGPPCQAFSKLRFIISANGHQLAENLTPEFDRCVAEARPGWFLMENVPDAPLPSVEGYHVRDEILRDVWVGGLTNRQRRFSFGSPDSTRLRIDTLALHRPDPERAVTCDAREIIPVKIGGSGKLKGGLRKPTESGGRSSCLNRGWDGGRLPTTGRAMPLSRMCELQGLPPDFLADKDCPLAATSKRKAVGNGVPLAMGRAVAKAVLSAVRGMADGGDQGARR